ncbi:MAG: hypothetical protein JXK05_03560 [Campylobacterales bacterium]|nr:hypothetical protein [Campylobacterales bacterium]
MRAAVWFGLVCGLGTGVMADYIVEYTLPDGRQTITYKDAKHHKLSIDSEGTQSHVYRIGEKVYMVSVEDGQTQVMDMDEMRKLTAAFGASAQEPKEPKERWKVTKTGRKESVAGVKGEVWIVEGEMDGEPYRDEVVMTQDKRVVTTFDALLGTVEKIGEGFAAMDEEFQFEKGWAPIKAEDMVLASVTERSVDAAEYELPKNAQVQKMPDVAGMFGGKSEGSEAGVAGNCYTQVCCGQSAGPSVALKKMLKESAEGFKLAGDGVCDILGFATAFGQRSVEGALYTKGKDAIQVTLNMNDSAQGSVLQTRQTIQKHGNAGLIQEVKGYKTGSIGGKTYHYGLLMPPKQQTLDILIDAQTTLSITHLAGSGEIDLIGWSKKAIDAGAYTTPAKAESKTKPAQKGAQGNELDKEGVNQGVDEAVQLFKSLF